MENINPLSMYNSSRPFQHNANATSCISYHQVDSGEDEDGPEATPVSICEKSTQKWCQEGGANPIVDIFGWHCRALMQHMCQVHHQVGGHAIECQSLTNLDSCTFVTHQPITKKSRFASSQDWAPVVGSSWTQNPLRSCCWDWLDSELWAEPWFKTCRCTS